MPVNIDHRKIIKKMKPRKNDEAISIKIEGQQLAELHKHTWQMGEAFGLDRKVEKYKGTREIKFYRWDVECLLDTISMVLDDEREYPKKEDDSYIELSKLFQRLKDLYEKTYDTTY